MPEPPTYLNRFTSEKRWESLRFRTTHGLQSSELNESQSIFADRLGRLGRGVYKDGHIVENARIVSIQPPTVDGNYKIEAGRIFIRDSVIDVPAGFVDVPLDTYVVIGIRYRLVEVTEVQDATLLNQAVGTRGYLEPGASRMREDYVWGWRTQEDADENAEWDFFYPVYEVRNGVVITRDIPPDSDPVVAIIAKYDRESSGNYVVRGLRVKYIDTMDGKYRFDVEAGLANILGYKIERDTNTVLEKQILSTTTDVVSEPHLYRGYLAGAALNTLNPNGDGPTITPSSQAFTSPLGINMATPGGGSPHEDDVIRFTVGKTPADTPDVDANSLVWDFSFLMQTTGADRCIKARYYDGANPTSPQSMAVYTYGSIFDPYLHVPILSENIQLNKGPIATVSRIIGTKVKTIAGFVKGAVNESDELPDVTVYDILSVKQTVGETTTEYLETTSWLRSGNQIDWSPGGAEPVVGSSYEITYTYQAEITLLSRTSFSVEVGGLLQDSQIFVDYSYSLPRKDLIVLNADGSLEIFEGESQARNPSAPIASTDQIALATVAHDWVNNPRVKVIAVRAIPFNEIAQMQQAITNLFELSAIAQLKIDGRLKIEGQALGIFVDSFRDNSNRDAANPQTASIALGLLQLPVNGTAHPPDNEENLAKYLTLDFTLEEVVTQNKKTGCMFVNPYIYVAPVDPVDPTDPPEPPEPIDPPVVVVVEPPIDPFVEPPEDPTEVITSPPIESGSENEVETIQLRYTPHHSGRLFNGSFYTRELRQVGIWVRGARPNETFVEILDWH